MTLSQRAAGVCTVACRHSHTQSPSYTTYMDEKLLKSVEKCEGPQLHSFIKEDIVLSPKETMTVIETNPMTIQKEINGKNATSLWLLTLQKFE